ncbi:class I SAM-dependent methyltransferase [Nocardia sp. NPDC049526]|uniref:class I SAM-dependent methyltransferase n=1 Tax=Nocardia sp. NPDC049526 TaxID=3364316 RepID=UPI0037BD097F
MNNISIEIPYATGNSRLGIERALIAAGRDLGSLRLADLALVEDFHTMGRIATYQLAELTGLTQHSRVLDAGSGIGGTARFIADQCGCLVTAVDLTADYCDTAEWLNEAVGLGDRIAVHRADVTALPFVDGGFDVAFSQHVQMNVADKDLLYREARRVLVAGGLLAIWDITAGSGGDPGYPLPWAEQPSQSHLVTSDALRGAIETAGFVIEEWNDLTEPAAATMRAVLASPPDPVGLHAFVPNFVEKAENLTRGLADGSLRAIQVIARS